MLHFITGRAGSGKTSFIYDSIKNLVLNGDSNIILFVPEQASFETEKDMLNLLGVKNQYAVDVLSFKRFCDRFYSVYKIEKEQCISEIGRTVLMSASLKMCGNTLELFSRQSNDFSFAKTMISLYEQMKNFEITVDMLYDASSQSGAVLGGKLRDISTIFTQYENMLKGEYFDPADKLSRVATALDTHRFFKNKTVFIDSFKGFTEQQMKIVEKIIEQAKDVYFGFCLDKNRISGVQTPFLNIVSLIDRIKKIARENNVKIASDIIFENAHRLKTDELKFLESSLYSNEEIAFETENQNVKIHCASDIYNEADFVAREIHRLTRQGGYRYRDFAVVARNIEDYLPAIDTAFNKRNISYFADRRRPASTKSVFRLARYALKSARTLATDDIMGMIKTGIFGLTEREISALENYTDIWQITRGWSDNWTGDTLGINASKKDLEKRVEYINSLREKVYNPLKELSDKLKTSANAGEKCSALFNFIEQIGVIDNLNRLTFLMEQKGDFDLADDERQSYDAFINVLDQIYMAVGGKDITLTEFENLFTIAADSCDIGEIPQKLDEVIVGAADRIRPKSPKVTFILGANYGVFPRNSSDNVIFSKAEFDMLHELGCPMSNDGVSEQTDERFLIYSLFSSPSEKLYISYSENDKSGQPIEKSEIVQTVEQLFPNCKFAFDFQIENQCDALDIIARDRETADSFTASIKEYFSQNNCDIEVFSNSEDDVKLYESTSQKCFGDNIVLSASKIDVYYQCRFRYLCQYILKIKPLKTAAIDVMERGTIVHYVLEKIVEKYADNPLDALKLGDEKLRDEVRELTEECLETFRQGREFSDVEKYSQRKLVKMMFDLAKRVLLELSNIDFKVYKTELTIGDTGGKQAVVPAFQLDIGNGRKVVVTGLVDRTDIYENSNGKYLRIIDYKTGKKSLNLSDVVNGQNIQMLLYMHALVKAMKQTDEKIFPAGVYYMPARSAYVLTDKNDKDNIESKLMDDLRYSGITSADEEIINAMDKTYERIYSPVKLKRGGFDSEVLFTVEQFDLLCNKIDELLQLMGNGLYENDFNADPINPERSAHTVCDYCDYRAICGRQPDEDSRIIKNEKNSEVLAKLAEKKGDNK